MYNFILFGNSQRKLALFRFIPHQAVSPIISFSVGDLTAVLAATLREHKLVITRADIDHIVQVNTFIFKICFCVVYLPTAKLFLKMGALQ